MIYTESIYDNQVLSSDNEETSISILMTMLIHIFIYILIYTHLYTRLCAQDGGAFWGYREYSYLPILDT